MDVARKLLERGRAEEALDHLKALLPTVDPIDRWRVHEMIGAAFHDLADPDGAAQAYFNAAQSDHYLRAQRQHYSNYLFALHYLPDVDKNDLAAEHFIYDTLYRDVEPLERVANRREKIAVGYVAPDFLNGAAARFYEPLLTAFDRKNFYVTCFSLSSAADAFTAQIKNAVDEFITVDIKNIETAARVIASHGLDILFDLGGHSDGGITLQLMAYRLAPVQISGIGWLDTTGLSAVDYILTDDFLTPPTDARLFTEKFLTVPHALVFTPQLIADNRRVHSTVTFGCFNNFMKVTDDYLECVAEILERVPNSRLIMQDTTSIAARRPRMFERVSDLLLTDRIEIRLGRDAYLDDYADVDIMLDTFPYNGGAMTATALCMGVPVISVRGDRYSARFGSDIIRAAGLEELIVEDQNEFVERAIELSSDPIDVSDRLKGSALLDAKKFVADVEEQYRRLKNFIDGGDWV